MGSRRRLTVKEISVEFLVGLFFFAGLMILAVFTIILSRDRMFAPKTEVVVVFESVGTLAEGDNVLVRGVKVGRVDEIALVEAGVVVSLALNRELALFADYSVEVRHSSVLGGRHVWIDLGTPEAGTSPLRTALRGERPSDLMEEASQLMHSLESGWERTLGRLEDEELIPKLVAFVEEMNAVSNDLRGGKGTLGRLLTDLELYEDLVAAVDRLGSTGDSVKTAADNLNGAIADARAGKGTLGRLLTDDSLYQDVRHIAATIREGRGTIGKLLNDDSVYGNLQGFSDDLRQIGTKLAAGESSLGRLLSDDGELYASVRDTFDAAAEVATRVRDGQGTLGRLINDPDLYEEARNTVGEVRGAIEDFREQMPISTFGSLVFGAL